MSVVNLVVRFLCEIAAIVALVWWGWPVYGILAAIGVVLVWWAFIGPKSRQRLPDPYRIVLELGIFGGRDGRLLRGRADRARRRLRRGRGRLRGARTCLA